MTHQGRVLSRLMATMILWGALGCAEPLPAHAAYAPADCPTTDTPTFDPLPEPLVKTPDETRPPARTRTPERMKLEVDADDETSSLVNLNTATQAELEALPGIGPSLAKRIIAHRDRRAFRRVSHLRRVKGIGKAKYRELKELVRVK